MPDSSPDTISRLRRGTVAPWFLGVLAVVFAAAASATFAAPAAQSGTIFTGACALSSVCVFAGVFINRPTQVRAWRAMSCAAPLFLVGLFLRAGLVSGLGHTVLTNVNTYTLAGYAALGAGLIGLLRGQRGKADPMTWLDASVVTAGAALVTWAWLVSPALHSQSGIAATTELLAGAYPIIDVLFLSLIIQLAFRNSGRSPAFLGIVLGAASLLIGDLGYALAFNRTADLNINVPGLNSAYVLAYAAFGLAALHPSMRRLGGAPLRGHTLSRQRKFLLTATMLTPAALPLLTTSHGLLDRCVRAALLSLLLLTVLARLLRTVRALVRSELDARYRATHDVLTGLPNRAAFNAELRRRLKSLNAGAEAGGGEGERGEVGGSAEESMLALLSLDCDRFKLINDTYGHPVGDDVLVEVGRALRRAFRAEDTVARLGGDEFVVLASVRDSAQAQQLAGRVLTEMDLPIRLSSRHEFQVTPSIGIALAGVGGRVEPADLVRDADLAMYAAKESGRGRWALFDDSLRTQVAENLNLTQQVRGASARGEIGVHFQPLHSLTGNHLVGFEALARWQHPQRGQVSPLEFIPAAEDTGEIVALGAHVLEQACEHLATWRHLTGQDLHVSVNLSPVQLVRDDVPALVRRVLEQTGVPAGSLWLEITESVALAEDGRSLATLHELRDLGVRLCVDDFGTGYSSLSYLKMLPVSVVKIDRSLVAGVGSDRADNAIMRAVIVMAHTLGMQVVAEGVETEMHEQWLTAIGCDLGQGWLFGRPKAPASVTTMLAATTALPAAVREAALVS